MALAAGIRLGSYEIVAPIGAGGMGEVYRARDLKLKRDVALKILPDVWSNDADRLARFQREAELLATLNHPNIAAVYGLEQSSGVSAIVLELVEGETLADRIARGPVALDETLVIARQMAEALEAAHDKGVVHRDLKPANIKITPDDKVKVLDFGLAKLAEPGAGEAGGAGQAGWGTMSPTLSVHATQAGMILGTAAYMSPEQARGKPVDRRTDIWAFGCVLFEMLTGRQTFDAGETVSDAVAAILRADPDWGALPAETPAHVRALLRRCLQKDPQRRLPHIGVARLEIDEGATPSDVTSDLTGSGLRPRRIAAIGAAGLAVGAVLTAAVAWRLGLFVPTPKPQPMRFAIVPPAAQPLAATTTDRQAAISPDGTHLVYVTGIAGGVQLMIRTIDRLEAEPVRGIVGARFPFFSPDGKWIGFFQGATELKKVSIAGGPAITLCRISGTPRGTTWGSDDTIVFATNEASTGLLGVPGGGGEPKQLTKPDISHGELDHVLPSMLPGGRAVLFTVLAPGQQAPAAQIAVLDLKTGQIKTLVRSGSDAAFVEPGYLVYASAGTLRAVRFDPLRLEVLSDPVPVLDQLTVMNTGTAEFTLSRTGTLVYVPAGLNPLLATMRSVVWVNRQGREEPTRIPPRPYDQMRLSPDATRLALFSGDQESDIWIWDLARETLTRFTFDATPDILPLWTPDGRRIVFASQRAGAFNLFWQSADGTGVVERLTTAPYTQNADSFSPDGTRLVLRELGGKTGSDLSLLTMDGKREMSPLLQTSFDERNGEISPDGRWLAYESNESGQSQIYVRPFPAVNGGRWQVSTAGGARPVWARSGRELFYLDGTGFVTSVPVQGTSSFSAGNPTRLFEAKTVSSFPNGRHYDVARDERFLVIKNAPASNPASNETPASMVVVLNWSEELKARLPAK